jgi:PTS system cellobiose-specific IIC component
VQKLFAFSRHVSENRSIIAIRKGLLSVFPLIIIASFSMLFIYFPAKTYTDFMQHLFGKAWQTIFYTIYGTSMGIISVALVATISYFIVVDTKSKENGFISPSIPCVVSLMCYFSLAWNITENFKVFLMSSDGILIAIICGVFATKVFVSIYSLFRRYSRHASFDSDPVLSHAISAVLPAIITLVLFTLLEEVIVRFGFKNSTEPILILLNGLLSGIGNTFLKMVTVVLMIQIMWFFGIHGNLVLEPVLQNVISKASTVSHGVIETAAASQFSGDVLMRTFFNVFVLVGGTGCTLSLLIAIFITARKTNTVKLAKISMLPAIFNINDILIFGLPIVLNPIFLIPFLLTPVVMLATSYMAIISGLVPHISSDVVWTTPPLLNAYYACGSIKGVILQIFNIAVGTIIYLPFVHANEKKINTELEATFQQLKQMLENKSYGSHATLINRNDGVGHLVGMLSKDILTAIKNNEFLLEYQPLINNNSEVRGVEALLRWPHKRFGWISPLVTTAIAEEAGSMNELGKWVIRTACRQLAQWKREGLKDISMSVNISPTQLQDETFTDELVNCLKKNGIEAKDIELEITESVVLELDEKTRENIEKLNSSGIRLAMDDFGMGYTSLLYIRHFNINTIKIDGSIIRDILNDKSCQDIVSSMVYLCKTLNIKVIAEYVEEADQFELLQLLGCSEYQGYLFSPPLPSNKTVQFISDNNALKLCLR